MKSLLIILLIGIANLGIAQTTTEVYDAAWEDFDKKNYKKALKKIDYLIENDGIQEDYIYLKGLVEISMGKIDNAYSSYTSALEVFPKSTVLYTARGFLLYNLKEFEPALKDYNKAIDLETRDSMRAFYLIDRSAVKASIRDFQGAYDDLLIAYNTDSTLLGALTNLGHVCEELGKGEDALMYLLKAVEIDSTFSPAYANIGFKYQLMGEYEKSMFYYDKVLELTPNDPLGYSNRAYNRLKLGDLKGAMKDINKSIEMYPTNAYAYRNRALIYIEMGKIKKACEDLDNAIENDFKKMYGNEVAELLYKYCD